VTLALAALASAGLILGLVTPTPLLAPACLIALWVPVAALVLLGGARGWMPRWAAMACCVLVPAAAWASWRCLGEPASPWGVPILAALPAILALYAFWAHFPILHRALRPTAISLVALGSVAVLSVAPFALRPASIHPASKAAPPAATARQSASPAPVPPSPPDAGSSALLEPDAPASPVARLTPDSPLAAYLPSFAAGGATKRAALERARLLDNRQAEAEALLAPSAGAPTGLDPNLEDLSRLDLAATPALCRGFGTRLRQEAENDRGHDGFGIVADRIEIHLETMNWLAGAGCDLTDALRAVQATAAAAPPSPERERFLAAIGALLEMRPSDGAGEAGGDPGQCVGAADASSAQLIAGCTRIIRSGRAGFGRLRAALVNRGNAFFGALGYQRAIADYSAALGLPPQDARVFVNRANAYDAAGDHDAALRDYGAAIALDPSSAMAFNNRGASLESSGAHDLALADLDQAIRLDPAYATAFANRGRVRFFLGRFADAAEDFAKVLALRPADARAVLWRDLAARRARPPVSVDTRAAAARLDHEAWPWPMVSVLLGEHDLAWGEQAALTADANAQAAQSCEAAFYLGEKRLADGATLEAKVLLRQAATGCGRLSIEGVSARAELARMAK
jgi:lipoprotein NlpI